MSRATPSCATVPSSLRSGARASPDGDTRRPCGDVNLERPFCPAHALVERTISSAIFRRDEVVEVPPKHEITDGAPAIAAPAAGGVHAHNVPSPAITCTHSGGRLDDGPQVVSLCLSASSMRLRSSMSVFELPTENGPAGVRRGSHESEPTIRAVEASEARLESLAPDATRSEDSASRREVSG